MSNLFSTGLSRGLWQHMFLCVFAIPGFRFEYMMLDSLHTLDLGVAQRLSGEVIHKMLKKRSSVTPRLLLATGGGFANCRGN